MSDQTQKKNRATEGQSAGQRRDFLRLISGAAVVAGAGGLSVPALAQAGRKIKIGYVSPQTGPLAAFGEADKFVLANVMAAFKGGIQVGGAAHPVEIIVKDSQSNPNRAAEVAGDLILEDKIDRMVVEATPGHTNA